MNNRLRPLGFHYPTTAIQNNTSFHLTLVEAIVHDHSETLRVYGEDFNSNRLNTIISCEHFHSKFNAQHIYKLSKFLGQFFEDVTVICFLRPQWSLATSLFSTRVIDGMHISDFDDALPDWATNDNPYFNYFNLYSLWSSAFSKLFFFDYKYTEDQKPIDIISNLTNVALNKLATPDAKLNQSLSYEALNFILHVNKTGIARDQLPIGSAQFIKWLRELERNTSKKTRFYPEMKKIIEFQKRFDSTNASLSKVFNLDALTPAGDIKLPAKPSLNTTVSDNYYDLYLKKVNTLSHT